MEQLASREKVRGAKQCPGHKSLKSNVNNMNIPNLHAITVKYHGPTNSSGSRVTLYSDRFKARITIPYDYAKSSVPEMAFDYLKDTHEIVGMASTREGWVLLSTRFDSIKKSK